MPSDKQVPDKRLRHSRFEQFGQCDSWRWSYVCQSGLKLRARDIHLRASSPQPYRIDRPTIQLALADDPKVKLHGGQS